MKLSQAIKALQALQAKVKGDPDVVVDADEVGYYNLEEVKLTSDEGEVLINLKSSNEM